MHMCVVCQSVFCYKFSLWEGKRAMCAMLCYSHFVKKSIQAVQTWSNSNSMHINVRHKTEQRFIAFLMSYASCTCVCGMSISASAMCAMLRYSHFVKKSIQAIQTWTNSNSMHADERHKTDQRFIAFLISYASCTCVCTMLPSQARCCATSISSRNRFKPYKLDRIATACILMCAITQNSVSLRFW